MVFGYRSQNDSTGNAASAGCLPYPNKIDVNFGMVNVNGFVLALPHDAGSERIFDDIEVFTTLEADDAPSIQAALLDIFNAVYDAAGEIRR